MRRKKVIVWIVKTERKNAFNERYACVKEGTKRTDRGTDTHIYKYIMRKIV